ncbi:unnamed protein product [Amoebophrya sp. A120]|nr:unnamed protein product [Amoebophrya sp. A120]|eukprot:GSA120T00000544001.1
MKRTCVNESMWWYNSSLYLVVVVSSSSAIKLGEHFLQNLNRFSMFVVARCVDEDDGNEERRPPLRDAMYKLVPSDNRIANFIIHVRFVAVLVLSSVRPLF